jgi:hypothetical protein
MHRQEPTDSAPEFGVQHTPDGTIELQIRADDVGLRSRVGDPDGDVALLSESPRHLAEDVTDHECARCGTPLAWAGGAWVSTDYTTTAGGLSFCPPDPDAVRVGVHVPR